MRMILALALALVATGAWADEIEAGRGLLYRACATADPFPDPLMAAQAKVYCNEMSVRVTGEVNRALIRPEVAGVIISHGTDTLEGIWRRDGKSPGC